jgi:protease I
MIMNKKVAILATNGFEESELKSPKEHIEAQGWVAEIVSLTSQNIKSWTDGNWGSDYPVDHTLDEVTSKDYDALVLPGGVINPDKLRTDENALAFVKGFFEEKKPVAAICHGPWTLINAGVVEGRKVTSYESIRKDLENAGANWSDEEVVVDMGLVTSRSPKDLDAFNRKMIEEIKEGIHNR